MSRSGLADRRALATPRPDAEAPIITTENVSSFESFEEAFEEAFEESSESSSMA